MKFLLSACVLVAGGLVHGEDGGVVKAPAASEFVTAASKVLERPYSGILRVVWPADRKDKKHEWVQLNFLRPADSGKDDSAIQTPSLATTEDGSSYWGAFLLRATLPDTEHLTSFASYKEMLKVLGPPTNLPVGGETDDKWAYDRVNWRFFAPAGEGSIDVLELSVSRKSPLGAHHDDSYLIESYSVRRGKLRRGEPAGDGRPAAGPGTSGGYCASLCFPSLTRWHPSTCFFSTSATFFESPVTDED